MSDASTTAGYRRAVNEVVRPWGFLLRMEHHQAYKLPERRVALVAKKRPTQCANPLKIFTLADLSIEFFDHDQPSSFAIWRRVWRLIVPGEIETGVAGYSTLGVEWHKTGD